MAKRKSKKKSSTAIEYDKVRKNLMQNIRRLKKRGYDLSGIEIPEVPTRKTKAKIRELKALTSDYLYEHAVKTIATGLDDKGEIIYEEKSGLEARAFDRSVAAKKSAKTRKFKKEHGGQAPQEYAQEHSYEKVEDKPWNERIGEGTYQESYADLYDRYVNWLYNNAYGTGASFEEAANFDLVVGELAAHAADLDLLYGSGGESLIQAFGLPEAWMYYQPEYFAQRMSLAMENVMGISSEITTKYIQYAKSLHDMDTYSRQEAEDILGLYRPY